MRIFDLRLYKVWDYAQLRKKRLEVLQGFNHVICCCYFKLFPAAVTPRHTNARQGLVCATKKKVLKDLWASLDY